MINRLGIRGRALIGCILMVLGTVASLAGALIWLNYDNSVNRMVDQVVVHASTIRHIAEPALLLNDHDELDRVMKAAARGSDVQIAQIFDTDGQPLAEARRSDSVAQELQPGALLNNPRWHDRDTSAIAWTANQLLVIVAIWRSPNHLDVDLINEDPPAETSRPLGYVSLTCGMDGLRGMLRDRVISSAVIALGVMSVALALTLFMVRKLVQPLEDLAHTSSVIAGGDLSGRASEDAVSEIGSLAQAFNNMATQVQDSYSSIEQQVRERTEELSIRKKELEKEIGERRLAELQLLEKSATVQLLQRIATAANEAVTLEDSLQGILDEVCAHTRWPVGHAYSVADDGTTLRHSGIYCLTNQPQHNDLRLLTIDSTIDRGIGLAGRVLGSGRIEWIADGSAADIIDGNDDLARMGLNSALAVPVFNGTTITAILEFMSSDRIEPGAAILDVLQNVATQLGRVIERECAQTEIREALVQAEAANRAKSLFLANMSHEIRTPMTAILGYAELLSELAEDRPDCLEHITTIQRNGQHLIEIINDILDLSKVEAGKLEVELIPSSPHDIVAQVASMMRVRAQSKKLALNVDYIGAIPKTIQTDPTRLRQALINLVGNAIKFTEQGSVTVRVALLGRSDPQLAFEVIDTGIGIPPDQVTQIFEPFQQADISMTRRFGGTGLGLTITRRISELLGGGLEVQSQSGSGSAFSLRVGTGSLDGVEFIDQQVEEAGTSHTVEQPIQDSRLSCRLLLIEDGPDNQRLISFVLRKAGAEVDLADNGRIGTDQALAQRDAGTPYDLILMDMQMPVMDGYKATRYLRNSGVNCPIIALTAHAMSHDRRKCLDAGCDEYTTKPINKVKLIGMIGRFVREGRSAGAACPHDASALVEDLASQVDHLQQALQSGQLDRLRDVTRLLNLPAVPPQIRELSNTLLGALDADGSLSHITTAVNALKVACHEAIAAVDEATAPAPDNG
jgi:signal transduction histidine kinase/DNA-binding response OmpR family regulator/HAMP domain-containing protein